MKNGGLDRTAVYKQPFDAFALAALIGLLAGYAEVGVTGIKKFWMTSVVGVGPHVLWMAPTADMLLLITVASILVLLGFWRPVFRSQAVLVTAFTSVSSMSVLLMYSRLHWAAVALLSLGLGVQASRIARQRGELLDRLTRKTVGWVIAVTFFLATIMLVLSP